ALIALWFVRAKWGRALFFAAAYYVVSLFPVLGFFSVFFFRYSFVSDHFQYLASMGPLALTGAGIATVVGGLFETPRELESDGDALKHLGNNFAVSRGKVVFSVSLCGILLVSLGFLTWRQTGEDHNLFYFTT